MKKLILALAVAATCAFAAPDPAAPRLITVSGEAEVLVAPDEAEISAGLEIFDKSLEKARKINDASLKRVLSAVSAFPVDRKSTQVDRIQVEADLRYDKHRAVEGYFVRKSLAITLKDLSRFDDLIAVLLSTGVTHIHGVSFRTSELRKHRDEARAVALRAAREKASDMAEVLGQKIGRPHAVSEQQDFWRAGYSGWWGVAAINQRAQNASVVASPSEAGPGSSALGLISVRSSVSVSFEIL